MLNLHADIIDSRDIIKRIEELRSDLEGLEEEFHSKEVNGVGFEQAQADLENWPDRDEYETLIALAAECESSPDWRYGESLIRDDYFEDYARELAKDCGMVSGDESWPLNCIDWEQAAKALQVDYFSVNFDGETYWIRG